MARDIVIFGATGYTGDLVVRALVRRGRRPVLAGRSPERLAELADEFGGLECRVADASAPESVGKAIRSGDVVVSTVGPFARWGIPALDASVERGATYFDSTGEPTFIREVFERRGDAARGTGASLLTAFAYDWVPGNLAGALAAEAAGPAATGLSIGYFTTGRTSGMMSGGTRATSIAMAIEPAYALVGGKVVDERQARRVAAFDIDGKRLGAFSTAGTEQFALPRTYPHISAVDTWLGWVGDASRAVQVGSAVAAGVLKIPAVRKAARAVIRRTVTGSSGGPDEAARAETGSLIVASAVDRHGRTLARATLRGVNPYTFTGEILAWGASVAADRGIQGVGALGPVEAFGLDDLQAGAGSAGLHATVETLV